MTKRLTMSLLCLAVLAGMTIPASAQPRAGTEEVQIGHYNEDSSSDPCAVISYLANVRSEMVVSLDLTNECTDRWLEAQLSACSRDGTRTERIRVFAAGDATLNSNDLRRLGMRAATRIGTVPGSVSTWSELPPADRYENDGGYYLIDEHGRIHDHTTERTYPRMEEEQLLSGSLDDRYFLARTNPRSGAITEFEFGNEPNDLVGHYVFEVRYRDGSYSEVFIVQTPPNSVVTMGRDTMAKLGIRSAVGVGDRLMEIGGSPENATVFDEDGNVVELQERGSNLSCPSGIT